MSEPRTNEKIRISPVLLIDADGHNRRVVPLEVARDVAEARGLVLVEVAPMATPPGVRLMKAS